MEAVLEGGVSGGAEVLGRRRRWSGASIVHALAHALVALVLLVLLAAAAYSLRDKLQVALRWVEAQEPWLVFLVFLLLFTLVSFPVAIGYLLLLVTAGYLLGPFRGLATVVAAANAGAAFAHAVLRFVARRFPLGNLLRSDAAKALLRVISGPHAFRIVLLARLTPVPFGLQNTIFALGNVSGIRYYVASCVGLLPAQIINVYLGSTLRSMHDVLQQSHVTGYIVFAFQITIGISLMIWVIQKAKKELTIILLEADIGREGGLSASSSSASLIS